MEAVLTREQVLAYAKPLIHKFIAEHAGDSPRELKEEMEQSANLRVLVAFDKIRQDAGWKSFVYNHARGAVLDYLKFGNGFQEGKWSLSTSPDQSRTPKLTRRVQTFSDGQSDDDFDIDRALGEHGIFSELEHDRIEIDWELLARMSSIDEHLHAFVRYIRGQSIEEMAPVFKVVRTRVSQMIQIFLERFDDPEIADDPWFKQTCYALGVCRHLGMEDQDQARVMGFAMGRKLDPVDLDWIPTARQDPQMDLFDEQAQDEEGTANS